MEQIAISFETALPSVEQFDDPESMSDEVGALPDMFDQALATYQGSWVLVATDLTTSGA